MYKYMRSSLLQQTSKLWNIIDIALNIENGLLQVKACERRLSNGKSSIGTSATWHGI